MENDYNQLEIDNVVNELLTFYFTKLKPEEIDFLNFIKGHIIDQERRDKLIKLYDSVSEVE